MFKIGNIVVKNNVVLAPMAGISNPSYIKLVSDFGLGLAFTELISAEAISRGNKKTIDMLNGINDLSIPVGVQIFGGNPVSMGLAAKYLCDNFNIKIIDINMGCPVPKVALRSGSGSAILKDLDKVYDIVSSVVNSVSVPVTVKIRSGWDSNSINASDVAKTIERAGAACISVHPRTRSQGYTGVADWNIIKLVKNSVSIPVIGNGDIKSCYDAKRMIDETGCDAVMIGRACIGNPWIIRDCVNYLDNGELPFSVSLEEKIAMIKKHLEYLILYKPERVAVMEMRMHISKYLKGIVGSSDVNLLINKAITYDEVCSILDDFLRGNNHV